MIRYLFSFLVCTFVSAQLIPSHPTQFTRALVLQGTASTFAVDVFGLAERDNPAIESIQTAFRHLADVWTSSVRVLCRITFDDLGRSESLASGGGILFVRFDGSPDRELMPIAAAEAITSRELNHGERGTDKYDVLIKINIRTPWHVDVSSKPSSSQYDLATVILHEAYHNLLFSGAITVDTHTHNYPTARLLDGYPARFDLFLANEQGCSVLDYAKDTILANATKRTPDHLLAQAVTNGRLFFHDEISSLHVPLYAPYHYQSKSSIYHVDTTLGATQEAALMNRYIPTGFVQREIGDEIRAMQAAFLNANNRGAKRCTFPLSDPEPGEDHQENGIYGSGADSGVFGIPVWAIVASCVAAALIAVIAFIACSHHITKKNTRGKPFPSHKDGTDGDGDLWGDKKFSAASMDLLIDDGGVSYDNISIDIRDLEIDEEDFRLFDHPANIYSHE